jgi:iron(III) transport system ATP-binding protein
VLLLDEPLSNLDPGLRERTRRELRRLIERIGITTILVTHEQEEAFDLADHVAVLQGGRLQQVATPQELYHTPATPFVVGFIGRASAVPVRVLAHDEMTAQVMLPGAPAAWKVSRTSPLAGDVVLHLRPEAVRLAPPRDDLLTGTLAERRFLGASSLYTIRLVDGSTLEVSEPAADLEIGSRVGIVPGDQGLHLFPAGRS